MSSSSITSSQPNQINKKRKKKGKKKKTKDINAPKRPLTPYMFYAIQARVGLKKEHPSWDFGRLSVAVGKLWRSCTDQDKVKFEKMCVKDKARYAKEMQSYVPPPESSSSEESEESGGSGADNMSDADNDDEDASSDEDEDFVAVRRKGKRSRATMEDNVLGPGPPYSRVEYYADINEAPRISSTLANYVPTLSTLTFPKITETNKKKKSNGNNLSNSNTQTLWRAVETSAKAVSATMTNGMGIIPVAMAPLPGFAKHVLLTQGRRSLACYITPRREASCGVELESMWNIDTLQTGYNSLSEREVKCMKSILEGPTNVGTCDLMSIPNYYELMSIPTQLMECRKAEKDQRMSQQTSTKMDAGEIPVSVKCIYVRINTSGKTPFEYCVLNQNTPWINFSSEVLAIIFEIEFRKGQLNN